MAETSLRPPTGRRIRVVFCIDNMGIGGTELNAVRTAERLDRSRFELSVLCLQQDGPLLARYQRNEFPVLSLALGSLHGIAVLRQGRRLKRYLAAEQVDIVHSHDVYNNIFSTFWARAARRPAVIASRRWLDDVPRASLRTANRYAYRLAHRVVANSETIGELLVDREGVSAERVTIIPNFVDESAFTPPNDAELRALRSELGVPSEAMIVGCVAGLRAVKGHRTVIEAMALLRARWPSLVLVLVGDGPERHRLEALTGQLGLRDVVHFVGARSNEPNPNYLFDFSVLASRSEAFPNTIVEAMAAGRPVVATRVGGVPDAVIDGETGLLVSPGDPAPLAAAINYMLENPERRAAMGRAAQQVARARFHVDRVIPQLESMYLQMLFGSSAIPGRDVPLRHLFISSVKGR
jgi:glycosyltransferase involved in cell wall biosynthesis